MENNNVTKKELLYILDLFEHVKVAYWLDSNWGVDILTGEQQGGHRDIDIDFSVRHAQKVIQELEDIGYKIEVDWIPSRMGLKHEEYGYLDIRPINLNDDGSITQASPGGGNYIFQDDWFPGANYKDRKIPCVSEEARLLFHSDYDLAEAGHFDIKDLKSVT